MRSFITSTPHQILFRWDGMGEHVASMGEMKNEHKFWLKTLNGMDHSEDLGVNAKLILEWM
jgi:hypothetical protein